MRMFIKLSWVNLFMTEITIIIPVYNAEKTLKKCLDSVKKQDYKNYEVVIVDDCSTDSSLSIAKGYGYKLIRLKKNSGSGKARNIGAKEAKTKLIAFTDSDCILPNDWLSRVIKNLKNKKVHFVCGGYSGSEGGSFLEKYAFHELLIRRKNLPKFVKTFPSNNFACYKDIFLKEKGFPVSKNYFAEDLEFGLEIGRRYKILWDKNIGVKHHFHKKIKKYLKQQNKFVIFYTALIVLNIFGLLFFSKLIYLLPFLLLILLLFDFNFLNYIYKKEGILFLIKSSGVLLMRNVSWGLGMTIGMFRFFVL